MRNGLNLSLLAFFCSAAPLAAAEVYRSDFSNAVSDQIWSATKTHELEPAGEVILGKFLHQGSLAMSHENLPAHELVRLRFDLLLFGNFTGTTDNKLSDGFSVATRDGPLLLTTNFNTGEENAGGTQSFPDEWSGADHVPGTGRVAGDKQQRYRFDLTFPHRAKELTLFFRGRVQDQQSGWGFSNVRIDVLDKLNDLPVARADALWKIFAGEDAVAASGVTWEFIAAGTAGLRAVEERWKTRVDEAKKRSAQAAAAIGKAFAAALARLGHDEFVERQKASAEISALGPAAMPLIETALADKSTPADVRGQLKRLQKRLAAKKSAAAANDSLVESRVARVRRVLDRSLQAGMRVTSSRDLGGDGWDGPDAALDGFVPFGSASITAPRHTWYPKFIGDGWLRIDFDKAREVSKVGVFWFFDRWGTDLPDSWRVSYLAADKQTWKPVGNPSAYGVGADKFNEVTFDKVNTEAVRIVVTFDGKKSTGVHEVYVE